jgi:hypothetical protein
MTVPDVRLHPTDAAELAELLQFLGDWLATDRGPSRRLAGPLRRKSRLRPQPATHRHRPLRFLLGADDGEQLFGSE